MMIMRKLNMLLRETNAALKRGNMDNYQMYLLARVRYFESTEQDISFCSVFFSHSGWLLWWLQLLFFLCWWVKCNYNFLNSYFIGWRGGLRWGSYVFNDVFIHFFYGVLLWKLFFMSCHLSFVVSLSVLQDLFLLALRTAPPSWPVILESSLTS